MFCSTLYLNIVTFYPLYVEQNFCKTKDTCLISTSLVAIAMGMFQLAGVVCPPIHSVTMVKMGRKNAVVIGFICMITANTGLGLLSFIPDTYWKLFLGMSMAIRFLQGYGDSLYTVVALSLISSNFPEKRTQYVSLLEAANGFGLILGPPLGGLAYSYLDYSWTFYAFSLLLTINLLLVIIYIPGVLNKSIPKTQIDNMLSQVMGNSVYSKRSDSKMLRNPLSSNVHLSDRLIDKIDENILEKSISQNMRASLIHSHRAQLAEIAEEEYYVPTPELSAQRGQETSVVTDRDSALVTRVNPTFTSTKLGSTVSNPNNFDNFGFAPEK